MVFKGENKIQIFLYEVNSIEIPRCGIMPLIVKENNKVKCVFLDEKDSIFASDLACAKEGK
jgi:hypothetical protein